MICESVEGSLVPAVLNPISESSAMISIVDPKIYFPKLSDFKKHLGNFNISDIKNSHLEKSCNTLIQENIGWYFSLKII